MNAEEFIEINYHRTSFLVSDKLIEDATGKEVGFEEIAEAYAGFQLKEKDVIISEYRTKMLADKESYFEVVEAHDDLETKLKEAKELLENAQPIWKENCAKWAHWYKRLKELI